MSERSTLSLMAIVCWLASAFFAINNIVRQASSSEWWLPLILLALGITLAGWAWMRKPSASPTALPKQEPVSPVAAPHVTPVVKEVAVVDAVALPKPPDTTEVMPVAEEPHLGLGLSAEEMAIQKPSTPQITANFDESQLEEAVRKAEATHAEREKEKERDETHPTRPNRQQLAADAPGDETQPSRREKPMTPAGLSAEEMAIQKPTTPHATERFDDSEMDAALARAKERATAQAPESAEKSALEKTAEVEPAAQPPAEPVPVSSAIPAEVYVAKDPTESRRPPDIVSAEQMAAQKPETTEITRRISRDLLPPTSTREMATKKPATEISTHELEATTETGVVEDAAPVEPAKTDEEKPAAEAVPAEAAKMADEKPATPLATMAEAIDPGALPVDTPLIDVPPPSTQMMEVEAAPKEPLRHISTEDTMQISTAEVAAEGPLNNDDLTKIEGIGPKIAAVLSAAGISTFSRLATTPEEELRDILQKSGLTQPTPTLSTWWEQAILAARGDWDALRQYQDNLGRRSQD